MFREKFGKNLKELRNEKGLTQKQLAKLLNVSTTTICQWETCKQEPCIDDIVFISKFFNISVDFLFGIED